MSGRSKMPEQWLETMSSQHAPKADINADRTVNLKDYAPMASTWLEEILSP